MYRRDTISSAPGKMSCIVAPGKYPGKRCKVDAPGKHSVRRVSRWETAGPNQPKTCGLCWAFALDIDIKICQASRAIKEASMPAFVSLYYIDGHLL